MVLESLGREEGYVRRRHCIIELEFCQIDQKEIFKKKKINIHNVRVSFKCPVFSVRWVLGLFV